MAVYKRYYKDQLYLFGEPVEPAQYQKGDYIGTGVYDTIEDCENDLGGSETNKKTGILWIPEGYVCEPLTTSTSMKNQFVKTPLYRRYYKNGEPYEPSEYVEGPYAMIRSTYVEESCCENGGSEICLINNFIVEHSGVDNELDRPTFCVYTNKSNVPQTIYNSQNDYKQGFPVYNGIFNASNYDNNSNYIKTYSNFIQSDKTIIYRIDISGLSCNDNVPYDGMFDGCTNLKEINFGFFFDLVNEPSPNSMMLNCPNLQKIKGNEQIVQWIIRYWDRLSSYSIDNVEFETLSCVGSTDDIRATIKYKGVPEASISHYFQFSPYFDTRQASYQYDSSIAAYSFGLRIAQAPAMDIYSDNIPKSIGPNSLYQTLRWTDQLEYVDLSNLLLRNCTTMDMFAYYCDKLTEIKLPRLIYDYPVKFNCNQAFCRCSNLKQINFSGAGFLYSGMTIRNATSMFEECNQLASIDISELDFSGCKNFKKMFMNCSKLHDIKIKGDTTITNQDLIDNAFTAMFNGCTNLERIDLSDIKVTWNGTLGTNQMFNNCNNLRYIRCSRSFYNFCCKYASQISLPEQMRCDNILATGVWDIAVEDVIVETWEEVEGSYICEPMNTGQNSFIYSASYNGTDYMYPRINDNLLSARMSIQKSEDVLYNVYESTITSLARFLYYNVNSGLYDYSRYLEGTIFINFDLSANRSLLNAFRSCVNVDTIEFSRWSDDMLTTCADMCYNCRKLTSIIIPDFKGEKITTLAEMFYDCEILNSDSVNTLFKNFEGKVLESLSRIFFLCYELTNITFNKLIGSNVNNVHGMFDGCKNLKEVAMPLFKGKELDAIDMFNGCTELQYVDLSSMNNPINFSNMFKECNNLTKIKCKRDFMNLCLNNASTIGLNSILKNGSTENWEIID